MRAARRDAIRFAILAVPLLAACLVLYAALLHPYESAVVRVANLWLESLARPFLLEVDTEGALALYAVVSDGARKFAVPRPHGVFLSLALLPALVLATPAPWRDRLRWILIALPVLFASHVVALLVLYRAHLVLREGPSMPNTVLFGLAARSGQLVAVALWALLTWRFWFGGPKAKPKKR
jgi:hypothetical protein